MFCWVSKDKNIWDKEGLVWWKLQPMRPRVVAHACNFNTREAERRLGVWGQSAYIMRKRAMQVWGHPGLHRRLCLFVPINFLRTNLSSPSLLFLLPSPPSPTPHPLHREVKAFHGKSTKTIHLLTEAGPRSPASPVPRLSKVSLYR